MQTLVKLMLRLTTKVATSPASSARSSSAASAHLLDHLGPALGEQRRQLRLGQRARPRARARSPAAPGPSIDPAAVRRPDAPRGMKLQYFELDHVEHALLDPLGRHVLRVDAEPLGQREAPRARAARAPGAGSGTAARARCGRRWPRARRGRSPPPRPARPTSRRGSAGPGSRRSGISRRALADQALHLVERDLGVAQSGSGDSRTAASASGRRTRSAAVRAGGSPLPRRPWPPRRRSRPTSRAVVAGVRRRSSAGSPPGCGRGARGPRPAPRATRRAPPRVSPIPTRIPLVNGIRSSPAASIVSSRRSGAWSASPAWTVSIRRSDRLEHQALRGGHLAQPGEVVAAEDAEVGVREQPALERALAGPDDVGGEVVVTLGGEPRGDLRVDLRAPRRSGRAAPWRCAAPPARGAPRPRPASGGAPGGWRRRSTCSSSGRCATATACSCARR